MNTTAAGSLVDSTMEQVRRRTGGRLLHRSGLTVRGNAVIDSDHLPLASGPVTVRLSKTFGSPGSAPDRVGVAVRFPAEAVVVAGESRSWDLVLSGPERRRLGIPLLWPAIGWDQIPLVAHGRFEYGGRTWRIFGELLSATSPHGLDLDELELTIAREPAVLVLTADDGSGLPVPIGTVAFGGEPLPSESAQGDDLDPGRVPANVRPIFSRLDELRRL